MTEGRTREMEVGKEHLYKGEGQRPGTGGRQCRCENKEGVKDNRYHAASHRKEAATERNRLG